MHNETTAFEKISSTIKSCETADHFVSAQNMISNYRNATRDEILKLNHELKIFASQKGIEYTMLEVQLNENQYN